MVLNFPSLKLLCPKLPLCLNHQVTLFCFVMVIYEDKIYRATWLAAFTLVLASVSLDKTFDGFLHPHPNSYHHASPLLSGPSCVFKGRMEGERERRRQRKGGDRIPITASGWQQELCNLKTSKIRCDIYADAGKSQTNVIPRSPREQAYLVKEHILPVMKKHLCISNPTPAKITSQSISEVIKAKVGIRSRSGSGEVHFEG